jgi:hypothetical protein
MEEEWTNVSVPTASRCWDRRRRRKFGRKIPERIQVLEKDPKKSTKSPMEKMGLW